MLYNFVESNPIFSQGLFVILTSILLSALSAPYLIHFLKKRKLGQSIRELGPKTHFQKKGTPTMGGVIFIIPPIVAALLFLPWNTPGLWIVIASFFFLALLGFIDDSLKLHRKDHTGAKPLFKIYGQLIISFCTGLAIYYTVGGNFYIPFLEAPLFDMGLFIIPWSMFVMISWSNSVNLTDGLDGLAGGLSVIAIIPIVLIGTLESSVDQVQTSLPGFADGYKISLFVLAVIGSLFIFLWFNGPPAQIFMGDTGSMALGGLFASCSLLLKSELIMAFVGLLFILESISVIIQVGYFRLTKGKRFFRMAPLHHHFEQKGIPENKIVLRAWIIQVVISLLSFLMVLYKRV